MISAGAIAYRTGITYRQVDHWTRRQYLRPIDVKVGHGHRRKYHDRELYVAVLMVRLMDAGFTVWAAAGLAREILEQWGANATDSMSALGPGVVLIVSEAVPRAIETLPSL